MEGIIEKISYERCVYEKVDYKSLSFIIFRKSTEKQNSGEKQTQKKYICTYILNVRNNLFQHSFI